MKSFFTISATILCLCGGFARAQTPPPDAVPAAGDIGKACVEGQVTLRAGGHLAVCDTNGNFKLIQQVSSPGNKFISSGAKNLRPVSADLVDGTAHLRFPGGASNLPVAYALGDDGHLALVNYKIVRVGSETEYVIPSPAETLVLKLGDREAIVQQQDRCSLRGVTISGSASVSCTD